MFEAISRAGCGRTGRLSGDGWELPTPAILYLDTGRFPAPQHSEATVRHDENGIRIAVGGSDRFALRDYSGLPHAWKPADKPDVHEKACIIRPGTTSEEIVALRGQIDLFILDNSIELYQNAKIFIDSVVRIREAIGYRAGLYLPGVALPNNIALLAYMGVDVLDSARAALLSGRGVFLTRDGPAQPDEFCACKACSGNEGIHRHNLMSMHAEMLRTRSKIAHGNIREHVEYRVKTSPKLVEMLRHLDMHHFAYQESRFPVVSGNFVATTRLALGRPDIVRFRRRIIERYRKPPTPDVLVLLPCSAKKPYSSSKSHGFFSRAIAESGAAPRVHEVIVTSPLGLVPRELELFYPAQHYDIPVTGHWFEDEKAMINNLLKEYLNINNYTHIINHLGEGLLDDLDAESTVLGSPVSNESLHNLTAALSRISGTGSGWKNRASEEIACMAAFQFGRDARKIFSDCAMAGRFPQVRVVRQKKQLATISQANGMLVPTIDGARLLAERKIHTVAMEDFEMTGNLFAVGVVSASPEIRVGDEVVVVRNGDAAASGTARMSGEEMVQSDRGEAVRVRHKAH
ncbi:MAG: archaeosine synthase subunit alpha [Thermoplasmata archaeon]